MDSYVDIGMTVFSLTYFFSDIEKTVVDDGCQISPTLRRMSMTTYACLVPAFEVMATVA
jgi:hypothetical protein